MKLEMKMTERDKKLLLFLALFVIIVGMGYWGIKPQIQKIIKINNKIEKEEQRSFIDDMKLVELPMIESENEELEKDILNARGHFYKMMTSNEVDKYMTNMVLSYNLNSYDLSIIMPTDEGSPLAAYKYSSKFQQDQELAYEMELEETIEEDTDKNGLTEDEALEMLEEDTATASEADFSQTGIHVVNVFMSVGGSEEDLQRFIDDLSNTDEKLWLKSYSWSSQRTLQLDEETNEMDLVVNYTLNINANLYMCEE